MRKDLDEISQDTMRIVLSTDIGRAAIADAEARGKTLGRAEGEEAARRQIYQTLCQTMPEAEARRITSYTGD